MSSYAYYRLPYANTYTRLIQRNGEPLRLLSYAQLDGQEGFVFAPFSITEECPGIMICNLNQTIISIFLILR